MAGSATIDEFAARRHEMVERQCRDRGIHDERVLAVLADLPREKFVPPDAVADAYSDRAVGIELSQTISQPYIVALMTSALDVQPADVVLEVGTGSGYQTAVLARLARLVYTVERFAELSRLAARRLGELGIRNVVCCVGDGSEGWPAAAPFDRIIVTAGSPQVPPVLVEQLRVGGRLVIPVGPEDSQTLVLVERQIDRVIERPLIACRFVKLVGRAGWPGA
jgi:protein-L-isoaspartate(D-aspartate) O-methyltransferase